MSDHISIDRYMNFTQQKVVLSFYHIVTKGPKPHVSEIGYYRETHQFIKDIAFFQEHYQSVSIEELESISEKAFHITFDDGLSEIYDEVLPILIKEKVHATFFINSDFIDNKQMFYRHKISLILNQIKNSASDTNRLSSFLEVEVDVLNKVVNTLKKEDEIDEIADLLNIDFNDYLRTHKPYLTKMQLLDIKKLGFSIGNHSENHKNFKDISFNEQKKQVQNVNTYLSNELNISDFYFSFPFGDENIKNDFFDFMYSEANIKLSFGVSGLKIDGYEKHLHRIPMEEKDFTAEQIIKFEYFYFLLKSVFNKNIVKR